MIDRLDCLMLTDGGTGWRMNHFVIGSFNWCQQHRTTIDESTRIYWNIQKSHYKPTLAVAVQSGRAHRNWPITCRLADETARMDKCVCARKARHR